MKEQMMPIILNENLERVAQVDDYISFIWTSRFYSPGDFELCCNLSYTEYIYKGAYIARLNDDHLGIVEKIQYKLTEDQQEMLIASGRLLPSILARRVISAQTQLTGRVTTAMSTLISQNAINPSIAARKITKLYFVNNSSNTDELDVQYIGENLLETLSSLCELYKIGMDCVMDSNKNFKFTLYDGTDRSINQSIVPPAIFSQSYENLLNSEYDADYSDYATDILVGGEGEGINRTMVWSAKQSQSNLARYEKFLDASSAVSNEQIITQETYIKQLQGLGLEEVTEYTTAFTGEIDFSNVVFGQDIFLGDICTINNEHWGMTLDVRLLEIIESVGEDGTYTVVPTFGE